MEASKDETKNRPLDEGESLGGKIYTVLYQNPRLPLSPERQDPALSRQEPPTRL